MWNLQDHEKITADMLDLNKKQNEDDLWWNQAVLTHLDLSSNTITEISSNIRNLADLVVLNVSLFQPLFKTKPKTSTTLISFKIMH